MNKYFTTTYLLTPEKCQSVITKAENKGYEKIDRGQMASYDRCIIDSKEFAEDLYERMGSVLPEYYNDEKVMGLNNIFRVSKYHPGEFFNLHRDGVNQDKNGYRSVITVNHS
jgi:prolyl 4-hydroxylase